MASIVRQLVTRSANQIAAMWQTVRADWTQLSLVAQFLAAATTVMAAGMLVLGIWVTSQIEAGVVRNTAVTTMFYLDSYIEPLVQGLAGGNILSDPAKGAIRNVLTDTNLGKRIISVNIRARNNEIVFSSSAAAYKVQSTIETALTRAYADELHTATTFAVSAAPDAKANTRIPLLGVLAPLHRLGTNEVIAVTEVYFDATDLQQDLRTSRLKTALIVAIITAKMLALLYGVVKGGSVMIADQRLALEDRVSELSRLLKQNDDLRRDLVDARARVVASNERILKRIGTDLHDGPAQLIGLALLRFHALAPDRTQDAGKSPPDERQKVYDLLESVLKDSLRDIRAISYGIAPPELDGMTLEKSLELAAQIHQRRTGTKVNCVIGVLGANASSVLKTCAYRFAQEGLNNSFKHAAGAGQQLEATRDGDKITIVVSDEGRGFVPDMAAPTGGLGLAGMRDRIESLGGKFAVDSVVGRGTRLSATFDLNTAELSLDR